jgi:hypothetical protein
VTGSIFELRREFQLFAGDELALEAFDALPLAGGGARGPWGEFRLAPAC